MHALVDTYSGLPISYIITPANIADMDVAEELIQKMMDDYENGLTPKYYMMDAGYDKPDLYSSIYHKFHGQAIIKGQLVCPMNYAYVYGGNDNGTIRLLCPHACGKCDCPMGSAWCTSAQSGYVGKVKIMARAKVFMDLSCIALIASRLSDAANENKSKAA